MSMIPGDPSQRAAGTPRYDDVGAGYGYGQGAGPAWLTFAAIMLGIAGVFGVIDGIVARRTRSGRSASLRSTCWSPTGSPPTEGPALGRRLDRSQVSGFRRALVSVPDCAVRGQCASATFSATTSKPNETLATIAATVPARPRLSSRA
jgi:hypothetical protein